jgi:hypothetical protein
VVYGADSAAVPNNPPMPVPETPEYKEWLFNLVMYADGRTALDAWGPNQPFAEAVLDGKRWHTRPDMIISAIHLLNLQHFPEGQGKIEIVGDVLPNAFKDKPKEWYDRLPKLSDTGEVSGFGNASTEQITMEEAA